MSSIAEVKSIEGKKIVSHVGMAVALVSFSMLFFTLMLGFAVFRFTAPVWPPEGMTRPSLVLPLTSTFIIALSSFVYIRFENEFKNDIRGLVWTIVLGFSFLLTQTLFWNQLKLQGIFASSGIFASIIYSFTWIHAAHIVMGLIGLCYGLYKVKKSPADSNEILLNSVGKFWHFLGIVWFILFLTIFVF